MKIVKPYLRYLLVICATAAFTGQVYAGNSWLEKGSNVLKALEITQDKTQDSTLPGVDFSLKEIVAALKDALKVGSENVVQQLGTTDGFNKDTNIHIPLPENLSTIKTMLDNIGMSFLTDELELKLNRAAEAATLEARNMFLNAISEMTFEDAEAIYKGDDDAATQYFKNKMSPELAKTMKPVIDSTLSKVGAINAYDAMMEKYKTLPFVPDVKANLSDHVVAKGIGGIFYYMAQEEKDIRNNPVKRTTELLQKIFKE